MSSTELGQRTATSQCGGSSRVMRHGRSPRKHVLEPPNMAHDNHFPMRFKPGCLDVTASGS